MKIERLRLSGFKSFVDMTELQIESGLTGIVGPNGCGKSNVLESLRWAMGATSAKSLRGSGMEDVIFSGTSARPARNMAEVCITLCNKDRTAPAAYNDSEVLEVVRRIERDAGSAYRINGRDVRARDVQLLFADASTGATSPALVRQGQIAELINAKPESRRLLLEEAAGITGLHSRRHEAELRLRAAETNLQRLDDVQQQIEDQLASLKRQARQATRYKNLSGHIRAAEAIAFHLRWVETTNALADAEARLKEIESQVEEAARAAAEASTRQAEAAAAVPPLREAEAQAAAAVQRLNLENETLEREVARARQQAENIRLQIEQITSDNLREHALRRDAETALENLAAEETALHRQQAQEQATLETAEQDVANLASGLAREEEAFDSLTAENADWHARKRAAERSLVDSRNRLEKLRAQLESTQNQKIALENSSPATAEDEALDRRIDEAEAAHAKAEDTQNTAEAARERAEAELERARAPFNQAEQRLNTLRAEAKALSDLLKTDAAGLWPPVIDAVTVTPGFETALAVALGEDLNAPTDEAAPVHWHLMEGPVTIALPAGSEPLSKFVTGPAQIARRLSQIGVVTKDQGNALHGQLLPGQRLVSREGDLWRWDGFVASAEAETAAAKRLAQRNRLKDLDEEARQAAQDFDRARAVFETRRNALSDANARRESCRKERQIAETALNDLRKRKAKFESENASLRTRLAALDEALSQIEHNMEETAAAVTQAEEESSALQSNDELLARLETQRAAVQDMRRKLAAATNQRDALLRESKAREQRLSAISQEKTQWQDRLKSADKRIENLKERKSKAQWDLQSAEEIPVQVEGKRHALAGAIEQAKAKRGEAADRLAVAEAGLADLDKLVKQTSDHLSGLREQRARVETQVEGGQERLRDLIARIAESLRCPPEQLLEKAEHNPEKPLPSLEEIEAKLDRLKRERDNMGAVNLRAEEESAELQLRLNELTSERSDLEGAIAKLRQGISALNQEGRARLIEAFDKVNVEFTRLFQILFDGGSARLELTEPDDPLNAGLEIFARPPGKRVQHLSLMSGGEQALSAMALIFAVFNSNPAPICFLDEVDAPLDDSNVERFCNLLHEMKKSAETKFIVITHHALTMANMDRLYGVTMAERGVSQLVSVDLAEAERVLEAV